MQTQAALYLEEAMAADQDQVVVEAGPHREAEVATVRCSMAAVAALYLEEVSADGQHPVEVVAYPQEVASGVVETAE